MGLPLLVEKEYNSMKSKIPPNQRGYCYLLKNCNNDRYDDGYDVSIGYEIITPAKHIADNPQKEDTERLLYAIKERDIAVVPFFKYEKMPKNMDYWPMEKIFKRTNGFIEYFLILSQLGLFYKAETDINGIVVFSKKGVEYDNNLDESRLVKILQKRGRLEELGFKLA